MKQSFKLRTIQEAMSTEAPTIGTFHREKSKEFTEAYISLWLIYLNDMLNLNKPLSEVQIELCAVHIVEEFYMLKVSELALLFKRIISGEFGEFYESISIAKVLTFFREYLEERFAVAVDSTLREHRDRQSDQTFNVSSNVRRIVKDGARGFNSRRPK
ncbi:MAG TPA: DUF6633 family protein [Flavobacteriaceae bacterium]|nr:DUF6633 family protein [Flavobacteriaceae bacterium]